MWETFKYYDVQMTYFLTITLTLGVLSNKMNIINWDILHTFIKFVMLAQTKWPTCSL